MSTTLNENLLLAVPLAPLAGALIAGLFGKAVGRAGAHTVTILGVAISFILSAIVFFDVMNGASFNATIYEWMSVGKLKFEIGFLVDSLTAMMMCVVTFVSLMVHIYTIGYMADDRRLPALLLLHRAVHVLDADARDEQQLRCSCSSAGKRWVWCRTC